MEENDVNIRIKALLEIVGKPKEFIEQKAKEYIEKIHEDENLAIIKEDVTDAQEKEGIWSAVIEIEVLIKGVENLVGFCIDYMPASVEVIKPETFNFPERSFTAFMNDMLAKLHRVDMMAKQLSSEHQYLRINMSNLIKNTLLILLRFGVGDLPNLTKSSGLDEAEVKRFLESLKKEGRVKEEEGVYSLV